MMNRGTNFEWRWNHFHRDPFWLLGRSSFDSWDPWADLNGRPVLDPDAPPTAAPEIEIEAPPMTLRSVADEFEISVRVPRSAFPNAAAPPDYFTKHNCEAQLGMRPRRFLDLLRDTAGLPVIKLGKLIMVRRDAMLEYLDRLEEVRSRRDIGSQIGRPAEPDAADKILLELGCTPASNRGTSDAS